MVNRASIDDKDFYTQYGIVVERVTGENDFPRIKEPIVRRWDDDHGDDVFLDKIYFESTSIQIACYVDSGTVNGYIGKINTFFKALTAPRPRFLKVAANTKGYLIYLKDCSTITRVTALDSGHVIGRFTLTLLNFCPVNRQFMRGSTSVNFVISSTRPVTIWWGDGSSSVAVGTGQSRDHSYDAGGGTHIVIYGPVETISSLDVTGAVEVT